VRKYKIEYKTQFIKDIEKHRKNNDNSVIKKIELLIDELSKHPKTGTGKPKPLKGDKKGEWSRRITNKHRGVVNLRYVIDYLVLALVISKIFPTSL